MYSIGSGGRAIDVGRNIIFGRGPFVGGGRRPAEYEADFGFRRISYFIFCTMWYCMVDTYRTKYLYDRFPGNTSGRRKHEPNPYVSYVHTLIHKDS